MICRLQSEISIMGVNNSENYLYAKYVWGDRSLSVISVMITRWGVNKEQNSDRLQKSDVFYFWKLMLITGIPTQISKSDVIIS